MKKRGIKEEWVGTLAMDEIQNLSMCWPDCQWIQKKLIELGKLTANVSIKQGSFVVQLSVVLEKVY